MPTFDATQQWGGLTVGLLSVSLATTPAHADAADDAAKLAREAEKLTAVGKIRQACEKLKESVRLDPRGTTALDLAICHEKEGRLASAYREFGLAAELARKEKRADRRRTALNKRKALLFRLPRLTVNIPKPHKLPGMKVTVNGEEIPASELGKPYPIDPGAVELAVTAPGHETWTKKFSIRKGQRVKHKVPKLKKGAAPAPTPAPTPSTAPMTEPKPAPPPPSAPAPKAPEGDGDDDGSGRLVVEVSAIGGVLYSDIERDDLSALVGTGYQYRTDAGSLFIATCGDTTTIPGAGGCEARFDPAFGGIVGAQAFVGWAVLDNLHIGVRGMGTARLSDGFLFAGGPSLSLNPGGPLWLGATFMLGASEHTADVASANGTVPSEFQGANGGAAVQIPLEDLGFREGRVTSGFLLGASAEIGIEIVGPSRSAAVPFERSNPYTSGGLMVSVFPTILVASEGLIFAAPAGLGYRFH